MEEGKVSKIIDARQACCYTTLTTPIKNAVAATKPGETLEIIVKSDLEDEFDRFVKEEGYEVLEEIKQEDELRFRIKR